MFAKREKHKKDAQDWAKVWRKQGHKCRVVSRKSVSGKREWHVYRNKY